MQLTGELSYRVFEAKDGYKFKEATIIGTYIEKVQYEKQERLDYDEAAKAALKS